MSSILQGTFVNLRPLVSADARVTLQWRQHDRARLLNAGSETIEQQTRWIESRPATEQNFIIELKDHTPIGMLSLVDINPQLKRAEPARFLIGEEKAASRVPAAVEAMKLLYELAFDELKLMRVYGTIAEENHRMIKWQKYLGMKEEGRLRRHYFINGRFQDAVCLGLLEEEYRSVTLPRIRALLAATSL